MPVAWHPFCSAHVSDAAGQKRPLDIVVALCALGDEGISVQAAELSGLKQEFLGVSLDHAAAQKRLKDEMASVDAALSAERTAHDCPIHRR